jgi:hypothetical protein
VTWVFTFAALTALVGHAPALAPTLNTPATIVLVDSWHHYAVPAATPRATAARSYKDYTLFRRDVTAGTIPSTVRVVIYDPEAWTATPLAQQLDPGYYEARFVRLAKRQGLRSILAPAIDLPSSASNPTDVGNAYSGTRLAGTYSVQTQAYDIWPRAYTTLLTQSAHTSRSIHPGLQVLSGLSTGLAHGYATGAQLTVAAGRVSSAVQGYWMNVAAADPVAVGDAADFLGAWNAG